MHIDGESKEETGPAMKAVLAHNRGWASRITKKLRQMQKRKRLLNWSIYSKLEYSKILFLNSSLYNKYIHFIN